MDETTENNIDEQIKYLEQNSDEELLDIIGAYGLSQQPNQLRASLAVDGSIDANRLRNTAQEFLQYIRPIVQDAICGPDGMAHYMEQPTVRDLVLVLLPALGISNIGLVPTALIAVALIIVRSGIREYCKDYSS